MGVVFGLGVILGFGFGLGGGLVCWLGFPLVVGCGFCDFRGCFGALGICVLVLWLDLVGVLLLGLIWCFDLCCVFAVF